MGNAPRFGWEPLALVGLLLLTAVTALSISDLRGDDEALYMLQGLNAQFPWDINWAWGPVYSDLYWVLGRLVSDPIDLYLAGRVMSAVAFVSGVWIAARIVSSSGPALSVAIVACAAPLAYSWPGVASPAAAALLVAAALAFRFPSLLSLSVATAATWFAAGMRPELVFAAVFMSVLSLAVFGASFSSWRPSFDIWRHRIVSLLLAFVPPVVLVAVHGSPFVSGDRLFVALSQHYTLRHAESGTSAMAQVGSVMDRDFPGAQSIWDTLLLNPAGVIVHALRNLVETPPQVLTGLVFDRFGSPARNAIAIGALLVLMAALLSTLLRNERQGLGLLLVPFRRWREVVPGWILLIVVGGISLVTIVAIYPRDHYLQLPVGLLLVAVAWLIAQGAAREPALSRLPTLFGPGWVLAGLAGALAVQAVWATIQWGTATIGPRRDLVSIKGMCDELLVVDNAGLASIMLKGALPMRWSDIPDQSSSDPWSGSPIIATEASVSDSTGALLSPSEALRSQGFQRISPVSEYFIRGTCG